MLDAREKVRATTQHRLARTGTRILATGFLVLLIGLFSSSDIREAVVSLFHEAPPETATESPSRPLALPEALSAEGQTGAAEELIRAANNVNSNPLGLPADGKAIHKEDIGFVMELLDFAQGPPVQRAPTAPKAKKDP